MTVDYPWYAYSINWYWRSGVCRWYIAAESTIEAEKHNPLPFFCWTLWYRIRCLLLLALSLFYDSCICPRFYNFCIAALFGMVAIKRHRCVALCHHFVRDRSFWSACHVQVGSYLHFARTDSLHVFCNHHVFLILKCFLLGEYPLWNSRRKLSGRKRSSSRVWNNDLHSLKDAFCVPLLSSFTFSTFRSSRTEKY